MLRRPPNSTPPVATPTEESRQSPPYSASNLPYTGEELEAYYSPGVASSSWQGISPSVVEVRPPPRPRSPPAERNDAGPSRNTLGRRLTYYLAEVRDFDPTYPELEPYPDDTVDDSSFVNFGLLSNIAVQLQLKVPRGNHVKGSVPYSRAFTGKDIVVSPSSHY
jgi:RHO1 GDP-GTP exchange protein 1/2